MTIESLLPQPVSVRPGVGEFELTARTTVRGDPAAGALARELLGPATGFALPAASSAGDAAMTLLVDETFGPEGYRLAVSEHGVDLRGGDARGLAWGLQVLRQLLPAAIYARAPVRDVPWRVPAVTIEDRPRFAWRGLMLDLGRWFMPMADVRRFVELAGLHRLNVVHLHLTEDAGWRFESRRYPRLTEVGAWRAQSQRGRSADELDATPHGGFYTQDELRSLVAFAATRGVTIVPEIDMPGHTQAAIAAYPHLGNDPDRHLGVATTWGISPHVLNPRPSTVDFMTDVLDEVMDVFPGEFVHIGGDECPKTEWQASPAAQAQIAELGLADENGLQSWFVGQLAEHLHANGRRLIGWDEILEGGLPPGATVMSWRGEAGGIAAAGAGHDVVMAPNTYTYFDYYQGADPSAEPLAIGHFVPLEKVYGYEPVPAELAGAPGRVLGTQGQLWTEYLPTPAHVEYMAFPRMCALAEVAWGRPDAGGFAAFRDRLRGHLGRLDALGVRYRGLD